MQTKLKLLLGPVLLAATIVVFALYLRSHPDTITQLRRVPIAALATLLLLYTVGFVVYVIVTRMQLAFYNKTMSRQENLLFNAYSSLINFFGPGQSGPIFRGAYLKKRHNLSIKQFTFTTLLYLAIYAVVSALFVVVGSRPWWQTVLVMLTVAGLSFVAIRRYKQRTHIEGATGFTVRRLVVFASAILVQVSILAVVYGVELHAVGAHPSTGALLSYAGVSNFSLFVALTPGAVGIREAFLVFSQQLHHINPSTIVAANVLDRAVYVVFLAGLFVLVLATHAKKKLGVSVATSPKA